MLLEGSRLLCHHELVVGDKKGKHLLYHKVNHAVDLRLADELESLLRTEKIIDYLQNH